MESFARDSLPTIKDRAYVLNFSDKKSKRTHKVSLFIEEKLLRIGIFFGTEDIPHEVLRMIKDKSIT